MSDARVAPSKWLTLFACCLGLGMLMVDTFVVNVAFPAIGRNLNASLSAAEWTVSGYVLVMGVLPIAAGRLGDLFGRKRVYTVGLTIFIVSSGLCGLAQNIAQLVAFRVLQGVGGAVMMPLTLSIIVQAFPPTQRGTAIGIWSGVSGLGLIVGPVLGGLLVRGDDWRWIFLVNLPLGCLALAMALRFVTDSRDESAPRVVDWAGLGALSGALALVMFGLTRGNDAGWSSPLISGCFAGAAMLLAAFVLVERRVRYPLVDLGLFRSGTFVMACLSAFLFSAAVFGAQPYTSLFMQNYWGFSPLEGGLAFVPATFMVAVLMPVSGILGQKLGTRLRLVVVTGALAVSISFLLLLRTDTNTTYLDFLPAYMLRGLGIGLVMSATSLAVVSAVPQAKSGLASGTLTMSRNIGTSIGVALLGAVFLHHVDTTVPDRLAGVPLAQVAQVQRAAEHFVPVGGGELRAETEQVIVDGFVLLAAVSALLSLVAGGAAFFIRHRLLQPHPQPHAGPTDRGRGVGATMATPEPEGAAGS